MPDLFEQTLNDVLQVSASASPTPGGGSVAAVVACFGLAMAAMVTNLTLGKEKFKDVEPQIQEIRAGVEDLMIRLKELTAEDMAGFHAYMQALRLPKESPEEKAGRDEALQVAAKAATETPLAVAGVCLEGLELVQRLAPLGNRMAISDDGVAAYFLAACVGAVLLSAEINLPGIRDAEYVASVVARTAEMRSRANRRRDQTLAVVGERMG